MQYCTHFTCQQSNAQNSPNQTSTIHQPRTSRCSSWIQKRQRNQRSNCQHVLDYRRSKRIPEKTSTSASLTTLKSLTVWITANCGKFFKRQEYQNTYLPYEKSVCRLRINSQNWTWNNELVPKWEKSYILSSCLLNLYAEYIIQNARLHETQAGIKIAGRNINNLKYSDDTTLTIESEKELKRAS